MGDTQGVFVVMSVSPSIPNQAFIEAAKRATVSLGVTGIQNYDPANVSRFVRFTKTLKRDRAFEVDLMTSAGDPIRDSIENFKERDWVSA